MPSEKFPYSLDNPIKSLSPTLSANTFVFATIPPGTPMPASMSPQMIFAEPQSTTLVLKQDEAEAHALEYTFTCRMITLHVQVKSTMVVAEVTRKLDRDGVDEVKMVSTLSGVTLFVERGKEADVLQVLRGMVEDARKGGEFAGLFDAFREEKKGGGSVKWSR